jgi:hypothetical protein
MAKYITRIELRDDEELTEAGRDANEMTPGENSNGAHPDRSRRPSRRTAAALRTLLRGRRSPSVTSSERPARRRGHHFDGTRRAEPDSERRLDVRTLQSTLSYPRVA